MNMFMFMNVYQPSTISVPQLEVEEGWYRGSILGGQR